MIKALILCGGKGERLYPLTKQTPKPLLPIGGVPIVVRQIKQLKKYGVKEIVFALGYKSEMFVDRLGDGSRYGMSFHYSVEKEPLGTGGAIRKAIGKLGDQTIVLNGDIVADFDYSAFVIDHNKRHADISIAVCKVKDPSEFGQVIFDKGKMIGGFVEKSESTFSNYINAGCYIVSKWIISMIPTNKNISLERMVFPFLVSCNKFRIKPHIHRGYWSDVGTFDRLEKTNKYLDRGGIK